MQQWSRPQHSYDVQLNGRVMPSNEAATLPFRGFHGTSSLTGPGTSGMGTARGTPSTAQQGRILLSARAHDLCDHDTWSDMQGTQFAQFSAEVLRRGAAAVLPQHLPDRWLDALLEEAELFAPEAWDQQEDDRVHDCCAGLLGAVLVILMEQQGHPDQLEVAVSTLMSHLHCYILALAAERVSRGTNIWLEPPTLATIFDEEREVRGRRRAAEGP